MEEKGKKVIPPYVSFKTFQNFLEKLKAVGIPSRIDPSVMSSLSGTAQSQLQGALKYLQLMSENGIPSEKLPQLVNSEGAERQKILKEILTKTYPFLFKEGVPLERITLNHMQELFNNEGASGGTTQKCIAFFIAMAEVANINVSSHIKVKSRIGRPKGKRTTFSKVNRNNERENEMGLGGTQEQKLPQKLNWQQQLLSKFPSFDPAWPDEVKAKWFDGFKDLREMFKEQSANES